MEYVYSVLFVCFLILTGCSQSSKQSQLRPDHIITVMEENHNYDQIVGNPKASYINSLIKEGMVFKDAHGIVHPSQPNYIALFSGSVQGVMNDQCLENDTPYSTPNLGHEFLSNGFTFTGYSESMPENGFIGCDVSNIFQAAVAGLTEPLTAQVPAIAGKFPHAKLAKTTQLPPLSKPVRRLNVTREHLGAYPPNT